MTAEGKLEKKHMRKLFFALVVAMGAFAFSGGTPAQAAGAAGAVTSLADMAKPGTTAEQVAWVRRCYWRYGRRVCRTFWRPSWGWGHRRHYRRHHYRRYY
jgi:hypothetical protein